MNKPKASAQASKLLDKIKSLAIQAMFSDDELLEQLVLKGGNAMALVHQISARASVDLDFSLKQDFGENIEAVRERILRALTETFRANGFEVFDFKMIERPKGITDDMKDFWGGYGLEFKLVTAEVHAQYATNIETLRKLAINLGQGPKFLIDISRFEYVHDKRDWEFEGTLIYVYSPLMIVCEKLRAICQQMPEYGPVIKRERPGSARPKDFVDIFVLTKSLEMDLEGEAMRRVLTSMFEVKRVPLSLLGLVGQTYEFHLAGFRAVADTVSPDFKLDEFKVYFDYVLELIERLKPVWDK
ncbi:nucleotidyl transferase AbiEii/AbiGii toxin family protein [Paraburkholderia sp. JPY303]|uniref:nucleotidyl transferase AbiEii/AbiGii toxin family protein n=1 Tax=Paraburkholderia atlantica TaxID=2654982 RepID=UPI0015920B28|nr:nucleotidyl transferase AbiEii/AbiGii toxin family protein [Paraburkholderia atlantica]NUY35899.1 nucleotidyl transferase AbiEii/AbiGii toxin family protein [Paraburkholderia atlantica]